MRNSPLWVRILAVSIVVEAIEIALLLHNGPVGYERSERWKGLLAFLPFMAMMAAIGIGFWRFAERANPGGERIFRRALAGLYTSSMAFVLAAITWFILFR